MPNTPEQQPATLRGYACSYRLRNGAAGSLLILAACSCDAVIAMAEQLGDRLLRLSVRPA